MYQARECGCGWNARSEMQRKDSGMCSGLCTPPGKTHISTAGKDSGRAAVSEAVAANNAVREGVDTPTSSVSDSKHG